MTVLTTADALLDGLPPMKKLAKYKVQIAVGDTLDFTELQEELVSMGYEREAEIAGPGQFAVRGGILELYPLTEEFPIRVELWGDEVDSIRSFDVESQRSIENLQSAVTLSGGGTGIGTGRTCVVSRLFSERRNTDVSG